MPTPFPFPLSTGVDICHVARIKRLLHRYPTFLQKVLIPQEIYALERKKSSDQASITEGDGIQKSHSAQYLAGRWAAKEAIMKAHTKRRLTMQDIWIKSAVNGAPTAWIKARLVESGVSMSAKSAGEREEALWRDAREARISITHDGDYAVATCLAVDE